MRNRIQLQNSTCMRQLHRKTLRVGAQWAPPVDGAARPDAVRAPGR